MSPHSKASPDLGLSGYTMLVSIFNDVIGPVMRGPSSSHCAAALRIARLARDLMGGQFQDVLVEFDRQGSLATTHESQGSDMGLFGGLLGWDAADERLPKSAEAIRQSGVKVRIAIVDSRDPHPNTYRLTLRNAQEQHRLVGVSTGGGMVEIIDVDEFAVSIAGDYYETLLRVPGHAGEIATRLADLIEADEIVVHESPAGKLVEVKAQQFVPDAAIATLDKALPIRWTRRLAPVLPVLSRRGMTVPFTTCNEMRRHDANRNTPLWKLAVEYEGSRSALGEGEIIAKMAEIVRIVRRSIADGIAGTHHDDRILGHQCGALKARMDAGRLLGGGPFNRVVLYVSALMEVKSSMGVIVAAPTAGACAAMPGACIAVAAGMAAAALVTLAEGSLAQAVAAASMAFQAMLGLICDPVANRVEVPCLGKNVMAAGNALACANMALADYDPVIPLDEVIETARRVGNSMPRELRCTALGGLSVTSTSREVERRLAERRTASRAASG